MRYSHFARLTLALLATVLIAAPATPRQRPVQMTKEAGTPIVIGRSFALPSRTLKDERHIAVYLPPGYRDPKQRFTVIYLLDGGIDEDFHHITGLARISAAYGLTREFIVVGIEGKDRRHDLTSPSSDPADLKAAPTSGGSAVYRRFLIDELKPWVEHRYRTDGQSALMGESLAGLFVVETMLRSPAAFDDYIAVSPSLWWDREALSLEAAGDLRSGDFKGKRLWLAIGDEVTYSREMKDGMDRLRAALGHAPAGRPEWSFTSFPAETHATIYHPAAMAAFRELYRMPPTKP